MPFRAPWKITVEMPERFYGPVRKWAGNFVFMVHLLFAVILVASFVFASPSNGAAVQPIGYELKLTPHHKLYDVAIIDAGRGWIAGSLGLIAGTEDGGKTWRVQNSGTKEALFSLSFVDQQRGWASGTNGTVLHTTNGGTEWKPQRRNTEQLFGIRFLSAQKGFSVGSFGTLLRTEDRGLKWEKIKLKWDLLIKDLIAKRGYIEPHLYDVFFANEKKGWIVGEFGLILHTRDGGETWSAQRSNTHQALFKIFFADDRRGWVAGQNGTLFYTEDGGLQWRRLETGVSESFFNILVQDRVGVIVGERGTLLNSMDGGKSWKRIRGNPVRITSWLQGLSHVSGNRFVVTGDRGIILLLTK